jgi:putative hydrolase of the HAD superfamily
MRYAAVIFDFGGVITSSPFEAFNRLEAERGLPKDFVRQVNSTNPDTNAWARLERGELTRETFDSAFAEEAEALGHALDGTSVLACLSGALRPAMVIAMDRIVAAGLRIGCITNNAPSGTGPGMAADAITAGKLAPVFARFEHVIESAKAGVRKPDPRIYQMMCEALEVSPDVCIYLDDLGINCKPAAALGMHAIKVSSERQALADLSAALGIALD